MLIDTHCHLNFKAFDENLDEVINQANEAGVKKIVVPGTDIQTSYKAIQIAQKYDGVYAAVGIHPHHVFEIYKSSIPFSRKQKNRKSLLEKVSSLLKQKKVVAIGEVGIDRYIYKKTKYEKYQIDEEFINLQKEFFLEQAKLAYENKKTLIIHNREAKNDLLNILSSNLFLLKNKLVFHCCEPDEELLEFAKKHNIFIGVDGDVVYWKKKQEFVKKIPIELLVLETDSPFLSPTHQFPNEPKNITVVAEFIAKLKAIEVEKIKEITTRNAKNLFKI
ncbi:MAG: TatD family hydrolase [Candidatus Microgenomates bacterium]